MRNVEKVALELRKIWLKAPPRVRLAWKRDRAERGYRIKAGALRHRSTKIKTSRSKEKYDYLDRRYGGKVANGAELLEGILGVTS